MLKIEKDVPLPPANAARSGLSGELREALPKMQVGDSLFVPVESGKPASVRVTVAKWQRDHPPFRFATRASPEGSRIWRVQ